MTVSDGERLNLPAYYADFRQRFDDAEEFWKLERRQVFAEPGNESWEAFDRGDWVESLRLIEQRREGLADYQLRNESRGMVNRRVRIVSLPPTPYLHWELRMLRLRDRYGQPVRVVPAPDIASLEQQQGTLPEICILDAVMYEVIYAGDGAPDHAIRYIDTALAGQYRDLISGLYGQGEPLSEFFAREMAPLRLPGLLLPGIRARDVGDLRLEGEITLVQALANGLDFQAAVHISLAAEIPEDRTADLLGRPLAEVQQMAARLRAGKDTQDS
jgi:hypothetical protein